ncbi:MAG: beta-lactamase family protein [Chlorobi bacterium]|nr:beta-lactamase family protein [Chlorobiota bacterium]
MKNILSYFFKLFLLAIIALFIKHSVAQQVDYSSLKEEITKFVKKDMKKKKITGLSVALIDNQETIWSTGFGYEIKSEKKKADKNTVYRIGSISKLFTATAIMQLVEEGKVNLDSSLSKYIPGFSIKSHFDTAGTITVRSVLTHESGLPCDYYYNFFFDSPPPENYATEYRKLPEYLKNEYVVTQPWYNFSYSNLGFSLLGNVVANVSGMDYTDYVVKNILDPMEMKNSSVIVNDRVKSHLSKGYLKKEEIPTPYIRDLAAGAILSSSDDMANFMKMIFANGKYNENQILKKETLESMFQRQNKDVALDLSFKIGITYWLENPLEIAGIKPVSHGGDLPPFHAFFMVIPEYKLGAIALSNSNSSAGEVRRIVIKMLQKALEVKAGLKKNENEGKGKKQELAVLNKQLMKQYLGYYASPFGILEFKQKGNSIVTKKSVLKIKFLPVNDENFLVKVKVLGFPVKSKSLKKLRMQYLFTDQKNLFAFLMDSTLIGYAEKVTPPEVPAVWSQRFGDYEIVNLDCDSYSEPAKQFVPSSIALKVDKKTSFPLLQMKMMKQTITFPFKPINSSEAITYGIGRNLGETIQFTNEDGEEILMYSGYKMKKTE